MRRLVYAVIVGLLTFSASGSASLILDEPCSGFEETACDEESCPPTCVTCGCCGQAAEPAVRLAGSSLHAPVSDFASVIPRLPSTTARDILHVPKI